MNAARPHSWYAGGSADELSAAQRAAVTSDARLVVVQGGPGAGKTEAAVARMVRLTTSLRQDASNVLALVTNESNARAFRARLSRALAAAGCPEPAARRTTDRVVPASALRGARTESAQTQIGLASAMPADAERRVAEAAERLAPVLGLARHEEEVRGLLLEAMRLLAVGRASHGPDAGDGDWFRRGVTLVEETVRLAQVETLRRLRMLEGTNGWIGDLGRQMHRPADVAPRARDLRSALDRALRSPASDRLELERLRGWVDVAAIDLTEATRREAVAAVARKRLWEAARALLDELAQPAGTREPAASASGGQDPSPFGVARHIIVDDAHDLGSDEMDRLREAAGKASLFVTGDQRAAWRDGGDSRFRSLLRDAGRAVVLLEAPRFGAGVGRFVNALGSRLWPSSEPGGYAPAIARLDSDPSAAAPVELWLVRRRAQSRPEGGDHPEPIADARQREALAVAAGAQRLLGSAKSVNAAVLVQDESARTLVGAALASLGVGPDAVAIRTVDECQGLEWATVFVTGLDEPLGGPALRRAWMDAETGLAVVWPEDDSGRRVWPFSSVLLAQRATTMRDAASRRRLFIAAARARTRLILSGVTRDRVAGGETCVAPVEWLRRHLGLADLATAPCHAHLGESDVRVRVVDEEPLPQA